MGTNDLLENLSVKRKSCRKVVEIRMDECQSLDVISCVFEGKSSMDLREGAVWGACCRWFESSHPDAEMEGVRCKNLTPSLFLYLSQIRGDTLPVSREASSLHRGRHPPRIGGGSLPKNCFPSIPSLRNRKPLLGRNREEALCIALRSSQKEELFE